LTSITTEHLHAPSSAREAQTLDSFRRRAVEELAGRRVWCAAASPAGRAAAEALRACIRRGGEEGVDSGWIYAQADDPLRLLDHGEATIAPVRRDDIVVLHDHVTVALARAIREHGAHVALRSKKRAGVVAPRAGELSAFLRWQMSPIDAYLTTLRPRSGLASGDWIAAFMPSPGLMTAREIGPELQELGWIALLADVARSDRVEVVGGTLHPRPAVAAR
jgi:hypothetical protein